MGSRRYVLAAVALLLAVAGLVVLVVPDRPTAQASAVSRDAATRHFTQQQLHEAQAKYAHLEHQIQVARERYEKLAERLKECEASSNPACVAEVQVALSVYETTLETDSQIIASWLALAQHILQNIH